VDKDTSYETFVIKMHQQYNNEVDMYGDVRKAGEVSLKVLEFGIPSPYETINSPETMKKIRSMARFNPDMPGSIELVHPNKFLPSKLFYFIKIENYRLETCRRVQTHTSHSDI